MSAATQSVPLRPPHKTNGSGSPPHGTLTTAQTDLIRASIPILSTRGAEITSHFYKNLLSTHPSLKNLFNLTNQRTNRQPFALASILIAYATYLTNPTNSPSGPDPAALAPALDPVNHRHASLGITADQYPLVGAQLLASMAAMVGTDVFTPPLRDAWAAAYGLLADMMIAAERDLYASSTQLKWGSSDAADGAWRRCRIVAREVEAEGVISLRFWPVDWEEAEMPGYEAGQYVSVRVDVPGEGVKQVRQYTLSDGPETARREGWRITPKKIGMVSEVLHGLGVGDVVELSFPRGVFWWNGGEGRRDSAGGKADTGAPLVLISAGIGITPMMSILSSELQMRSDRDITWLHSTRSLAEQPFVAAVKCQRDQVPKFKTVTFLTGPVAIETTETAHYDFVGRMDLSKLDGKADLYLDNDRTLYYICGPTVFMESIGRRLKDLGVTVDNIKTEVFGVGDVTI